MNIITKCVAAVLILLAFGKAVVLLQSSSGAHGPDPIIPWLSSHDLRLLAMIAEVVIGVALLRDGKAPLAQCALYMLSTMFFTYHLAFAIDNDRLPCGCLGYWQTLLGLSDATSNRVTWALLLVLFAVSAWYVLGQIARTRSANGDAGK
jgi:hypothetical protein